MACVETMAASFGLRYSPSCSYPTQLDHGSVQLNQFKRPKPLRLSSSQSHIAFLGWTRFFPTSSALLLSLPPRRLSSLTIVSAKGYKMKSHKHAVSRSDYDNVIGALPYLKVNRKAEYR